MKKLSIKTWISIGTLVLVLAIVILSRRELIHAWYLMADVNLWKLSLFIPVVFLAYLAAAEMSFSYIYATGSGKRIPIIDRVVIALELNFVNHVLPSAGASGMSYMTWRLRRYDVPVSRATMSQVVRAIVGFTAFAILLIISVLAVTIDSGLNRFVILLSSSLVGAVIALIVAAMYFLASKRRLEKASVWIVKFANRLVRTVTFGRVASVLRLELVQEFMYSLHEDYLVLRRQPKLLKWPMIWGLVAIVAEILTYWVTFWALGAVVNPAAILIAYGVAMVAAFAVMTPGGSGAFEALMIMVLAVSGVGSDVAIAGVILTRVLVLFIILVVGYVFYQRAIMRHGKQPESDEAGL